MSGARTRARSPPTRRHPPATSPTLAQCQPPGGGGGPGTKEKGTDISAGGKILGLQNSSRQTNTWGGSVSSVPSQFPPPTVRSESSWDQQVFCRIWIPGFSELAKIFYEILKGEEKEPLVWDLSKSNLFKSLKPNLAELQPWDTLMYRGTLTCT